ncbi:3-oxoadipyl-CoA thiolase [Fodinicurvata sp. EGI_FJ10296]|uniref:3-oxoadipyl-CoA thiolase n=1 Tax=Fodinicurvata sp. EGI_FJ10296 TaxID=3231908 RepID=UPI003456986E
MNDAFIYGGVRTPFGRYGGALSSVRPDDLAAATIREVVSRYGLAGDSVDDVVLGCATQAGEDSRNVARHAALLSGLPESVPGQTANRLCGSGLAAVIDAARAVSCGHGDILIAGGVESMSRAPLVIPKAETAFSRSTQMYDSTIGSRFPNKALTAQYGDDTMPQTADNVAGDHGIGREESDAFAAWSQERYAAALASGVFDDEIMPVTVKSGRKGETTEVKADEHPRPSSTADKLAGLKPLFEGGTVTAGNASGVNDGAAALVIGGRDLGDRIGHAPLVRMVSAAVAGVAPRVMGLGPVPAGQKALERAGLTLADMDIIEINEAFAAQVLGCLKLFGLPGDDARVNPNGGAIAVGHPLGASGARLALTTARHLQRTGGRYALVSLCVGVGQGIAMVIERV